MKKLKDLVYDYNDIFLAIVIIIVAGAVIFWKVSDIMAYPTFAKNQQQQEQEVNVDDIDLNPIPVDENVNPGTDEVGENTDTPTPQAPENNPTPLPAADTKFEVKQGDFFSTAADKLLQAGLIKDKQEFIKTVQGMGLENKLQIGIFTIPAGSSDTEIAKILTKTNQYLLTKTGKYDSI